MITFAIAFYCGLLPRWSGGVVYALKRTSTIGHEDGFGFQVTVPEEATRRQACRYRKTRLEFHTKSPVSNNTHGPRSVNW